MRIALAFLVPSVLLASSFVAEAAPNPGKARDCRGEMAKMVAMGLIQHAEKTGPTTMTITTDPVKWKVLPAEMKRAVGTTIACVVTEGDDLDAVGSEITFVVGDTKAEVGKLVGTDLVID